MSYSHLMLGSDPYVSASGPGFRAGTPIGRSQRFRASVIAHVSISAHRAHLTLMFLLLASLLFPLW